MKWLEIKILTTSEGLERVMGLLCSLDITSVQISDKEDFKEFLERNRKYWDYVDDELEKLKTAESYLTFYLSDDEEGKNKLKEVKKAILKYKEETSDDTDGSLDVLVKEVKDEDWSENWKQYFKPIEIGKKILVVPEWEAIPETDRSVFIINPGMSFGTGSHESTKMCIEHLEQVINEGDRVVDLGCGSGILSVISLILGAKEVDAVDIDDAAVKVTYENLERNGFSKDKIRGYQGDVTSDKKLYEMLNDNKADIVLANIVADVIISLSKVVKDFMRDDGVFICSGVIKERCEEVKEKLLNAGLLVIEMKINGEWASFLCRKKL